MYSRLFDADNRHPMAFRLHVGDIDMIVDRIFWKRIGQAIGHGSLDEIFRAIHERNYIKNLQRLEREEESIRGKFDLPWWAIKSAWETRGSEGINLESEKNQLIYEDEAIEEFLFR